MNKLELIEAVVEKVGLSKKDVEAVINAAFAEVREAVKKGDTVKLTGFGTFAIKTRQARNGTNPRTGEQIKIAAAKSVGFKPAKEFKESL